MDNYDAVILADGEFPKSEDALQILRSAQYLCCCDNAGKKYIESIESGQLEGFPFPDAIVGDGDSVPEDFRMRYAQIYHQLPEQEFNDLTKATRYVVAHLKDEGSLDSQRQPPKTLRIAYLGTTGLREDHSIGNIFLLPYYQRELGIHAEFFTDYGTFVSASKTRTFRSFPRQQVSIFNISCNILSGDGLKWRPYRYEELWQGTLNEALDTEFTIFADGQYIIYRTHQPK